jgi:hypothetical protein
MKIVAFMILTALLGGGLSWFYFQPKKFKRQVLNRKTYLTLFIILVTMSLFFGFGAFGSLFTLKVF